jgi:chemosensory pili system protein ChpA (sensor histidine kinase/response regulator)
MLGIYSIQQISHKLEDYFKILKEHPLQVDQRLESLFLQGFDPLRDLLEELQSPFGISDAVAEKALAQVDPVFAQLHKHLLSLTGGAASGDAPAQMTPNAAIAPLFQSEVPNLLRQMLQLFKQGDHGNERSQVVALCSQLEQLGGQFGLSAWAHLLQTSGEAAAHPENSFSTLAPVLIREVKAAADQVIAGQPGNIAPSAQMQALVPVAAPEPAEPEFQPAPEPQPEPEFIAEPAAEFVSESTAEFTPAPAPSDPWEAPQSEGFAQPESLPEMLPTWIVEEAPAAEAEMPEVKAETEVAAEANVESSWVIEEIPAAEFEAPELMTELITEPMTDGDLAGQLASLFSDSEADEDLPDFEAAMAAIPGLMDH